MYRAQCKGGLSTDLGVGDLNSSSGSLILSFLICKESQYLQTWLPHKDLFAHFYNFFFIIINLFIFGCVGSSLLCAGATLRCSARASHCSGFSCCRARALGMRASVVAAPGLSSCSLQAQ